MRVLVCGGREFSNKELIFKTLDAVKRKYPEELLIIHGAASGADLFAEAWAKDRQVPYLGIPAEWLKYGRKAGPIRNKYMADNCNLDACVAFAGGNGTKDMLERVRKLGIEPWLVGWKDA